MQLNFKEWFVKEAFDIGPLDQKGKAYLGALIVQQAKAAADEIDKRQGKQPQQQPPAPGVTPKSVKDQAATLGKELINNLSGPLTAAVTGAAQGKKPPGAK